MTTRDELIEAGVLVPANGDDEHARTLELGLTFCTVTGPVFKIDAVGRAAAKHRIAHPEEDRGEWKYMRGGER